MVNTDAYYRMALSEASWFLHMVKVAEVSRAARHRRDVGTQWRRLCPRLSSCSGNNHKTYWSRCIYIPSSIPAREMPQRRSEGKNWEGRWKGTTSIIYRKPSFSSTETFRSEKHPEKRERVKIIVGSWVLVMRNRLLQECRSKISIVMAFIVKLYDHAIREKLSKIIKLCWFTLSFIDFYE